MTDTTTQRPALPDHLSIDPRSPHYAPAVFEHEIGIHFNDKERFDVEEYCLSEGWIKVPANKLRPQGQTFADQAQRESRGFLQVSERSV